MAKNTLIGRILNFLGRVVGMIILPAMENIIDNTVVGKIVKGIYEEAQNLGANLPTWGGEGGPAQ